MERSNSIIHIKNMVCDRCIRVVTEELRKGGFDPIEVKLGTAELGGEVTNQREKQLIEILAQNGFELLTDHQSKLVEEARSEINHYVRGAGVDRTVNLSMHLEKKLLSEYTGLSKLFSSYTGVTIEQYAILQRIERVKELLVYDELTLSQIAFDLGYSSVSHLSSQFKRVTGMTPSLFKKQRGGRKPLDKVHSE